MSISEQLTRDYATKNNIDPRGTKWGIVHIKGTALYEVHPVEGNTRSAIPKNCDGRFTNPTRAQVEIEKYLKDAWVESDAQAQKLARKTQAQKETA